MNKTQQYQNEFIAFQDELKSFIYRLTAHRQETEDLAQETFIKTFKNIDSFKEKATFKKSARKIKKILLRR